LWSCRLHTFLGVAVPVLYLRDEQACARSGKSQLSVERLPTFPNPPPARASEQESNTPLLARSSSVMSMTHLVSRRMFVSASSAIAAGFVSGVPLLAAGKQGPGAKPGEQLTAGMIDFHVHTAPDTAERTVTAVEAARTALDRGLRAIVLKGTAFETVTRAAAANAEVRGIQVFGGVVFNWSSGGVNPAAVEAMVNMRGAGAEKVGRVVWMPSNDSRKHFERFKIERPPVDVFSGGKLVPAKHDVLALCAKHDLVLQTCHLSPRESIALIKEARAAKGQKIVCTHADYDPISMSVDDQRKRRALERTSSMPTSVCTLGRTPGRAIQALARCDRR